MSEFTGERVIPGLVDDDLFNEHVARYRFATRVAKQFGPSAAILDAGCGTGYGSARFEFAASVTAMDISDDAVQHARENFARPNIRYTQASCESLPFSDASFDLVCAFEVIEHLERWDELIREARRVLKPAGLLIVSTPNKAYYAEARAEAGPNPFHTHEFEYAEFEQALSAVFPNVRLWSQNHAASVVFAPARPVGAQLDASGDPHPEQAHFFLALCGQQEIELNDVYAWLPSSGNLLRERERHIAKLTEELAQKDTWLERQSAELAALQTAHEQTLSELQHSNRWAESLDARVIQLQTEADERLGWISSLEGQIATGQREIERLNAHREQLERDLAERAAWGFALDDRVRELTATAESLSEQIRALQHERQMVSESKWIRLGKKLSLGPRFE